MESRILMDTKNVLKGLTLEPDIAYEASWNGDILTAQPDQALAVRDDLHGEDRRPGGRHRRHAAPALRHQLQDSGHGLKVTALVPAPNVAGVSIHSQIAITFDTPIDPASVAGAITITPPVAGSTTAISLPDDAARPTARRRLPPASAPTCSSSRRTTLWRPTHLCGDDEFDGTSDRRPGRIGSELVVHDRGAAGQCPQPDSLHLRSRRDR